MPTADGVKLVEDMGIDHHIETSALTGMNVGTLFETITKHLYLEHNGKLGEFRDDGASYMDNQSAKMSFTE